MHRLGPAAESESAGSLTAGAGRAALVGKTAAETAPVLAGRLGRAAGGLGETNQLGCASEGQGPRRDTVPILSCPEEQKLRFQGADHSASLPCPSSPGRKSRPGLPPPPH